jgi:hypothetical protein
MTHHTCPSNGLARWLGHRRARARARATRCRRGPFVAAPWAQAIQLGIAAAFLLAVLAGCGSGPPAGYRAQQQVVDGLRIELAMPQQPQLLKEYDLFVTLADAAGRPVDGATVFLDLTMPAMPMGQNQPVADGLGGGRYRARTVFTMEGGWRIAVHVAAGGKKYLAAFDQPVSPAGS